MHNFLVGYMIELTKSHYLENELETESFSRMFSLIYFTTHILSTRNKNKVRQDQYFGVLS